MAGDFRPLARRSLYTGSARAEHPDRLAMGEVVQRFGCYFFAPSPARFPLKTPRPRRSAPAEVNGEPGRVSAGSAARRNYSLPFQATPGADATGLAVAIGEASAAKNIPPACRSLPGSFDEWVEA